MAKKAKKSASRGTNTPSPKDRVIGGKTGKIVAPKVTKAPPTTIKGGGNRGS